MYSGYAKTVVLVLLGLVICDLSYLVYYTDVNYLFDFLCRDDRGSLFHVLTVL